MLFMSTYRPKVTRLVNKATLTTSKLARAADYFDIDHGNILTTCYPPKQSSNNYYLICSSVSQVLQNFGYGNILTTCYRAINQTTIIITTKHDGPTTLTSWVTEICQPWLLSYNPIKKS